VADRPDRLARFEREAKALAALNHPNIATVHGFERAVIPSEDPGSESTDPLNQESDPIMNRSLEKSGDPSTRPSDGLARDAREIWFLVMELLEGESLREVIGSGAIPTSKAIEYATAIANGLAAAHDKEVIHRDLKPENVLLTRNGHVKILDFGLAKLKQPEGDLATETPTETLETENGRLVGTVAYMSPEQLQGCPADHRSDIFSLGVVLYEMLAGKRPFSGSTQAEISAATLKEDPTPISSVSSLVPSTLSSVVTRCLEKRPGDRFSSAHDLSLTLSSMDLSPPAPGSFVERRWPHILAVVIAAIIGLLVILPPEALVDRVTGSIDEEPIRSIAILPLENMTGDPEQDYLVDGIHEELILTFSQFSGFEKVINRTSVLKFRNTDTNLRDIGEILGIDAILVGSVRRDGHTIRISLQLIDSRSEDQLWAESFDRALNNILILQSQVASTVASEVRLALTPREKARLESTRPVDEEAYEAYLKGTVLRRQWRSEQALTQARDLFEQAIELDPEFAPAYVGLSIVSRQLGFGFREPAKLMQVSYDAALKAVELDPDLPDAHITLANSRLFLKWDWAGAGDEFARAIELDPNNSYAQRSIGEYWIFAGDAEKAIQAYQRGFEVDPLPAMSMASLGWGYYFTGQFDEAIEHLLRTIDIHPNSFNAHWFLSWAYREIGEYDRALIETEKAMDLLPGSETDAFFLCSLVIAYDNAGRTDQAAEALARLIEMERTRYVPPSIMAYVYVGTGDHERAIDFVEQAYSERDSHILYARAVPLYDPLRSDPRFQEIIRRMNFP
jgi:serine/threonine protein kinase/Tfp pilus assembly protein PilF